MDNVWNEIEKIGIIPEKLEEIRTKNGISLYRLRHNSENYVLKYFAPGQDPVEIEYYSLLAQAGITTPVVIGKTDCAILMEDLQHSPVWRLATEKDLDDPSVAHHLAAWYKTLHDASEQILPLKSQWYCEYALLTEANLRRAAEATDTVQNKDWAFVIGHLPRIRKLVEKLPPVVNYNDFYYTNLAVARSANAAMMFDYNCVGKGYRAADLRNVRVSLSVHAAEVFLESYGKVSDDEFRIDNVVSALTTLIMAAQRNRIPAWAQTSLNALRTGKLAAQLDEILNDTNNITYRS